MADKEPTEAERRVARVLCEVKGLDPDQIDMFEKVEMWRTQSWLTAARDHIALFRILCQVHGVGISVQD